MRRSNQKTRGLIHSTRTALSATGPLTPKEQRDGFRSSQMAAATLPSFIPLTLPTDKYRGAVVEDLQLPPAFSVSFNESISRVIGMAYERDFSHVPVLNRNRRPLGYVDVANLKEKWESGLAKPDDKVNEYMTRFNRSATQPYKVITPLTPLTDLEEFLKTNIFALVTDLNRKFVLAVATAQDLESFATRRGS